MGTQIVVPSPQHRYLEPFKNRTFQYDTKHSNLFLSRYTNQILNAVGDDSIVRGLEVTPELNSSKTGINFIISPGALVQDLTYFEFQKETIVPMDDLSDFSDYYVVVYSNYRYIETVYENPLKFEATLYNPRTKRALSPWSTINNRIILGVYSFTIDSDHLIQEITEEDSTIFFEEANVIRNGTFDEKTTDSWTAINAVISAAESGGALDSPYVIVQPAAGDYQGIAQAFTTKPNLDYEISFYVKSDESVPFEARLLDRNAINSIPSALVVKSYESTSTKRWSLHTFRFTAFTNQTTLLLLKKSENLENKIYFDHICVFEYTPTRKRADLHQISMIDGGRIPTTEDIIPVVNEETSVIRWNDSYREGSLIYDVDCTQHGMPNSARGQYLAFFNGRYALPNEYYVHWKNDQFYIYVDPGQTGDELAFYYLRNPDTSKFKWRVMLEDGISMYSPAPSQEAFPNPVNGTYLAFFNGELLNESSYSIDYSRNVVQFESSISAAVSKEVDIYFITEPVGCKTWTFKTAAGVNAYYLSDTDVPFESEDNGKYLVFLDGMKVWEGNYLVKPSEGSITLTTIPAAANAYLRIYYFYDIEPVDETPKDEDYDVYKWKVSQNIENGTEQTVYPLDVSRDHLRPESNGYYIGFKDNMFMQPFNYSINGGSGNSITFSRVQVSNGSLVEFYFVRKSAAAKYQWSFKAEQAGTRSFTPKDNEPVLQSPDDGNYMIFLNNKKLSKNQYNVMFAANVLQISDLVEVPQHSTITAYFITSPVTNNLWEFETVSGSYTYHPKDTEPAFMDYGDGEYLCFLNDRKLSSREFVVDPIKNALTLVNVFHTGGDKIELYFLGKE